MAARRAVAASSWLLLLALHASSSAGASGAADTLDGASVSTSHTSAAAAASAADSSCTFAFPSLGVQFNLAPLRAVNPFTPPQASDGFSYQFAVCDVLPKQPCLGGALASSMQLMPTLDTCLLSLGTSAAASAASLADPAQGLTLTLGGGDLCPGSPFGARYETVLTLLCDPLLPAPALVTALTPPAGLGCALLVTLRAGAACPAAYVPPPPSIGVAYVVLIVAVAATVAYLGGGIAYKRAVRGATGVEAIPNIDSWRRCARACRCAGASTAYHVATSDEARESTADFAELAEQPPATGGAAPIRSLL